MEEILMKLGDDHLPEHARDSYIESIKVMIDSQEETCDPILQYACEWFFSGNPPLENTGKGLIERCFLQHPSLLAKHAESPVLVKLMDLDKSTNPVWFISIFMHTVKKHCNREDPKWMQLLYSFQPHVMKTMMFLRGDEELFRRLSSLMLQHPEIIPDREHLSALCEVLINFLASFPPPEGNPGKYHMVADHLQPVVELAVHLIKDSQHQPNVFACLQMISNQLMKDAGLPSPVLSLLLDAISRDDMSAYLEVVFHNALIQDVHLERTVENLCQWLIIFPRSASLHILVVDFLTALAQAKKYSLLVRVINSKIETLVRAIQVPLYRRSILPVVCHMLFSFQHSPAAFHRALTQYPAVIEALKAEKSSSSKDFLSQVLKILKAQLGVNFGFPKIYDPLDKLIPESVSVDPGWIHTQLERCKWLPRSKFAYDVVSGRLGLLRSETGKAGLANLGNTCFANSVLQALFLTDRFRNAVLQSHRVSGSHSVLHSLQKVFGFLAYSPRDEYSPDEFIRSVVSQYHEVGVMHDCAEFLRYLLDHLHEEEHGCNKVTLQQRTIIRSGEDDSDSMDVDEDSSSAKLKRWTTEENLSEETAMYFLRSRTKLGCGDSPAADVKSSSKDSGISSLGEACTSEKPDPQLSTLVHQCFGGILHSVIECRSCGTKSVMQERFRDLVLHFPEEVRDDNEVRRATRQATRILQQTKEVQLQDLISERFQPEHLRGENSYMCDHCEEKREAQRTLHLIQAPIHLILTLMRFSFNSQTLQGSKILTDVIIPPQIELPLFTSGSDSPVMAAPSPSYHLYATIFHSGYSLDTGHYYCHGRHSELASDDWFLLNDSQVTPESLESLRGFSKPLQSDSSYVLFYRKMEGSVSDVAFPYGWIPESLRGEIEIDSFKYLKEQERMSPSSLNIGKTSTKKRDNHDKDDDSEGRGRKHFPPLCGMGDNDLQSDGGLNAASRFIF